MTRTPEGAAQSGKAEEFVICNVFQQFVAVFQAKLDWLAETGAPLWITELDVREPDVNKRATGYVDVMTMYLSHPAVTGITLWGYWDMTGSVQTNNYALAEGDDVTVSVITPVWPNTRHSLAQFLILNHCVVFSAAPSRRLLLVLAIQVLRQLVLVP